MTTTAVTTTASEGRAEPSSDIIARFEARTATSRREWEDFGRNLPDGHTRATAFFRPHPVVLVRGEGPIVTDADGNRYFDLLNNYTSLVHGNAHPLLSTLLDRSSRPERCSLARTACRQTTRAVLCERLPNAAMVRYTNSGTEASMMAVRIARAATGRRPRRQGSLRLPRKLGRAVGERRGAGPRAERLRRAGRAARRARPGAAVRVQRRRGPHAGLRSCRLGARRHHRRAVARLGRSGAGHAGFPGRKRGNWRTRPARS